MTDFIIELKIFDEIFDNLMEIFPSYYTSADNYKIRNNTATTNIVLNILCNKTIHCPEYIPVNVSLTKNNTNFILEFINKIILNTEGMLVIMEKGLKADPQKVQFWELEISKERLLYYTSGQYLKPKTLQTWDLARLNERAFQNAIDNIGQYLKPTRPIEPIAIELRVIKPPALDFPRTHNQINELVFEARLNGTIFTLLATVPKELKPLYIKSYYDHISFERYHWKY